MKNKLIAIFTLCIATFACAQSVPTIGKYAPREHRGFYNSTSFGTAYNWFYNSLDDTDKYNDRQRHDIEYYEFISMRDIMNAARKLDVSMFLK